MSTRDLITIPGYTVHQFLGKGGMAAVYLATQESLHRQVAIKVLLNADDDAFNARFVSEARIIATLNHPRIITVHDVAQLPDGRHYIAMEYLSGGDLTRYKGHLLPPEFALDLVRQIAEGLSVVHRKGIIHRDIKPGNILFREDGSLVLTDFGIAKDLFRDTDLTQTGMTLGSPSYCSPEQTHCEPLDQRADIYSLGAILLEMLLGYNPFKGSNYTQTVLNHSQMAVPELPAPLKDYQSLLEKMLAKNPDDRFASADALLSALRSKGTVSQLDVTLTSTTAARSPRPVKKTLVRSVLILFLLLTLGTATGGGYLWKKQRDLDVKISSLLANARQRITTNQLTQPVADNAEYFFNQVLALDAHNAAAQQGLQEIRTLQISALLKLADERLESRRLSLPAQDNAIHYYQQVLLIDPDNSLAKTGLRRVVVSYIGLAQSAYHHSNYAEAQDYISKGLALDASNVTLLELKNRRPVRATPIERFFNRILN